VHERERRPNGTSATSIDAVADDACGWFSFDTRSNDEALSAFDAFRYAWASQIDDGFPLPALSPATMTDFQVTSRAVTVGDATIVQAKDTSAIRTAGQLKDGAEDKVRLFVVQRGAWSLGGGADHHEHTVTAGSYLLRYTRRPLHFQTRPDTAVTVLVLPTAQLAPLLGGRDITGPADTAELRLLTAHANMVHATAGNLRSAGVQAAHTTLIELAKAVAMSRFDDTEPHLTPVLVQAVKDLADRMLAEPELSAPLLAGTFNISLRTLQRAFATTGETATAYIRRRRLEEARRALTAGPLSVSELAAHWQFADSSHFTRAFRQHFGQTPTEYARRSHQ
jgi:AraC-like DNA-binding protein